MLYTNAHGHACGFMHMCVQVGVEPSDIDRLRMTGGRELGQSYFANASNSTATRETLNVVLHAVRKACACARFCAPFSTRKQGCRPPKSPDDGFASVSDRPFIPTAPVRDPSAQSVLMCQLDEQVFPPTTAGLAMPACLSSESTTATAAISAATVVVAVAIKSCDRLATCKRGRAARNPRWSGCLMC